MKTFRFPRGHVALTAMTVAELRAKLSEYPDDMPVLAEWEGQHTAISEFTVEPHDTGFKADRCDCLILDVN